MSSTVIQEEDVEKSELPMNDGPQSESQKHLMTLNERREKKRDSIGQSTSLFPLPESSKHQSLVPPLSLKS